MCCCGLPDEVYKLIYEILVFFDSLTDEKRDFDDFPISQRNTRECFVSWLIFNGLVSPKFKLTLRGESILRLLMKGYPKYQNDPMNSDNTDSDDEGYSENL